MKKEKSKYNKKVIVLSLFLLVMISTALFMQMQLIRAQSDIDPGSETSRTVTSSDPSFFQRWLNSTFSDLDAKLILWLMVFIVLLVLLQSMGLGTGSALLISIPFSFVLTAYVTPAAVLGIFRTYSTLPLAIATILPLLILFGVTYLSVIKGSRTLMTMQVLFWGIYFFFNLGKALWGWFSWVYNGNLPYQQLNVIKDYITVPGATEETFFWFWIALLTVTVISGIMTLMNGRFMNMMMRVTLGVDQNATTARINTMKNSIHALTELGKEFEKGKK